MLSSGEIFIITKWINQSSIAFSLTRSDKKMHSTILAYDTDKFGKISKNVIVQRMRKKSTLLKISRV